MKNFQQLLLIVNVYISLNNYYKLEIIRTNVLRLTNLSTSEHKYLQQKIDSAIADMLRNCQRNPKYILRIPPHNLKFLMQETFDRSLCHATFDQRKKLIRFYWTYYHYLDEGKQKYLILNMLK